MFRRSKKKAEVAKKDKTAVGNVTTVKCNATADQKVEEQHHSEEKLQKQDPGEKAQTVYNRARSLTITPRGGQSKVIAISGKAVPLAPKEEWSRESSATKENHLQESKIEEESEDEIAVLHFEDDFKASEYPIPQRLRADTEMSLKFESTYDL